MANRSVRELMNAYISQEGMHSFEGRRGVLHLCKIAGALGYKDTTYYQSLPNGASVGDLLMLLEDNSGLVEAMLEWLMGRDFKEFREPLEALVPEDDESEDDAEWNESDGQGE